MTGYQIELDGNGFAYNPHITMVATNTTNYQQKSYEPLRQINQYKDFTLHIKM
jgi:hypothetical protein